MLYYKGKPIGGVGTLFGEHKRAWQHVRADIQMYSDEARNEIAALEAGNGQSRYRKVIAEIDSLPTEEESEAEQARRGR